MDNKLFRQKSVKKISEPVELKDYIHVTTPGLLVGLAAVILTVCGLLVWGIFGSIPITQSLTGICHDGVIYCYSETEPTVAVGMDVVGEGSGTVQSVSETPLAAEEIQQQFADYEVYQLALKPFEYEITVAMPDAEDGTQTITVITERTRPVSLIFQ